MSGDYSIRTTGNGPIDSNENGLLTLLGQHTRLRRRYTKTKVIEGLAINKYNCNGNGVTFNDLLKNGLARHKRQAQTTLKRCRANKILFTLGDHRPQRYYPTCLKYQILEKKKFENIPLNHTEVDHTISNSTSQVLESKKMQNFYEVLCSVGNPPLGVHKIQLKTTIHPEFYKDVSGDLTERNKAKQREERFGGRVHAKYLLYPNGTIMVHIACSNNPYRLETDEDQSILFSFLGQVRDRLLYILSDLNERIVPHLMEWRLVGCDINRDVEITEVMQLSGLDIQLKHADRVFRLYIRSNGGKAFYRAEESIKDDSPLYKALSHIRNPAETNYAD
jgi:hypothetical protein